MKLKELEKRLKQEPDNLGLRVQVAGLMRESGRSVEAVELYRSVALAYRDQGRHLQAIAVCRSILGIVPEDAACQGLLAMLQQRGTPSRPPIVDDPTAGNVPALPRTNTKPRPVVETPEQRPSPEPQRRSSLDETPLPKPVPYHVVDPTSRPNKISSDELDLISPTHLPATTGLAQAARRISGLISDSRGVPSREMDLASELDTRQRPRIDSDQLRKIDQPPPTVPIERIDPDDLETSPPRELAEDFSTDQVDALTPPPRASEDAMTPPPLTGIVPPKPPQPPPGFRGNPSRPPATLAIPPRNISRDSDDELTQPRDRLPDTDDD